MDRLRWLQHMFQAPVDKLLLIFGSLFVLASFISVSRAADKWTFGFVHDPNWWLLSIGLVQLGIFLWFARRQKPTRASETKIENGRRILVGTSLQMDVVTGGIEDIKPSGQHYALVLPANTSFDDECIRDERTSLGAFFQKHFPQGIDQIQRMIKEEACKASGESRETFTEAPPGTTLLLDRPLGSSHRIFVTAVTRISPGLGITADTLSLLASIKSVCRLAVQHRLSDLYMPVLGTGHGGLDFSAALSLLLVQAGNCILREGAHHINRLTVVVHDPDGRKAPTVERVVHSVRDILEEG